MLKYRPFNLEEYRKNPTLKVVTVGSLEPVHEIVEFQTMPGLVAIVRGAIGHPRAPVFVKHPATYLYFEIPTKTVWIRVVRIKATNEVVSTVIPFDTKEGAETASLRSGFELVEVLPVTVS